MNDEKDIQSQRDRVTDFMVHFFPQLYPTTEWSVGIDAEKDRVIVIAGGSTIAELGPKEWFMDDQQLRDYLRAATENEMGPGMPPRRFKGPQMN